MCRPILLFSFVLVHLLLHAGGPPLDPGKDPGLAYVFEQGALPKITLEITLDQWDLLLAQFDANPKNEEKVIAAFVFEKEGKRERMQNIGFRIRGNLSRKRPEGTEGSRHNKDKPQWHQAHFKVDFRKFDKTARFRGLRGLNLKFFNNDPSYVREVFCYNVLREFGIKTTPLSSYARVFVHVAGDANPAYFGIYQMVEPVDKHFLQARFDKQGARGDLWKCLYQPTGPADLVADIDADSAKIGREKIHPSDEKQSIRPAYDLKTNKKQLPEAKQRFLVFLDQLNNLEGEAFERWFANTFDSADFLKFLAANTLLGMWDDYWVNANNYYLYLHPKGRVFFIPYDYDNTLGTSHLVPNAATQNVFYWGAMDYSRPLVYKVLRIPRYREDYAKNLKALLAPGKGLLDPTRAMQRVRTYHHLIQDYVENDTDGGGRIEDKPAAWARKPFYRLLSGDDRGMPPEANVFKTRARFAHEQLKLMGF